MQTEWEMTRNNAFTVTSHSWTGVDLFVIQWITFTLHQARQTKGFCQLILQSLSVFCCPRSLVEWFWRCWWKPFRTRSFLLRSRVPGPNSWVCCTPVWPASMVSWGGCRSPAPLTQTQAWFLWGYLCQKETKLSMDSDRCFWSPNGFYNGNTLVSRVQCQ